MTEYVVATWKTDVDGPVIAYEKVRSARAAVATLIDRINWTSTAFAYAKVDVGAETAAALDIARAWVPSMRAPKVVVRMGKYEIEAYRVAS